MQALVANTGSALLGFYRPIRAMARRGLLLTSSEHQFEFVVAI